MSGIRPAGEARKAGRAEVRTVRRSPVAAVGRWSAAHPWRAIALWFAFVVSCVALVAVTNSKTLSNGANGESAHGYALLDEHNDWPNRPVYVYLHSDSLRTSAPAFRSAIADASRGMQRVLGAAVTPRLSRNRRSALLTASPQQGIGALEPALAGFARDHPQIEIA